MSQSAWAPNCDKSGSLIYLPLTALLSDLKSSLISQLAPCISQNKTPPEINRPTLLHIVHIPPFIFQYFVKTRLSRDGADVHGRAISFLFRPQITVARRTPGLIKDKTGVSNWSGAPFFVHLAARNAGVAWAFWTFATEAKLSMTMFDDGDNGGGGGETTKPCSSNVPRGIIKTVCVVK